MKIQSLVACAVFSIAACASSAASAGNFYLLGAAGATNTDGASSSGTALKLQLGYMFNSHLAVEGGYIDAGTQKYNFGTLKAEAKTTGGSIAVLGLAPLGEQFSVFGKLGYNSYSSSVSVAGYSGSGSGTNSGTLYGVGGIFNVSSSVGVRVEYEKVASDTSITTLGVQFKF